MQLTASDKENVRALLLDSGAAAVGFAAAGPTQPEFDAIFSRWLGKGCHGTMAYMANHAGLRRHPAALLDNARTVIVMTFPYNPPLKRPDALPRIGAYALGLDYHKALRHRLKPPVAEIKRRYGADCRICIDSAPVHERYWATKAGVGRRGENGCIIIDGFGSYVFLAELLTTASFPPDAPSTLKCLGCGKCRKACPGNAIMPGGYIDARRCLSYLTIEHRGPLSAAQQEILDTQEGRATLYGCDICQQVCPHNHWARTTRLPEFIPSHKALSLTAADITACADKGEFAALIPGTPMTRADFDTLRARAEMMCGKHRKTRCKSI